MRASVRLTTAIALAAVAVGCGGKSKAPSDLCTAPTKGTTVELKDFEFAPVCLDAGDSATITLENAGGAPHTYTVSEIDVNVNLGAGDSDTVDLSGAAPGTYRVVCTYHPQMVGALRIGSAG
jgi:plastocyanin